MYHSKKIALFISHIYGEFQKNLCQGVISRAAEFGYQTEIYATNDGENLKDYGHGEESILRIPDFRRFDGVLFAAETYSDPVIRNKISGLLKSLPIPILAITNQYKDFPQVLLDNNSVFTELTAHLIRAHGCRTICYLGSGREPYYSELRRGFFKNTLEKNGLTAAPCQFYTCDETSEDYHNALSCFTMNKTRAIDAIVCYNDRVAMGLWGAALQEGYCIPGDFAVTGCDCTRAGQNCTPPLTTATFPCRELGEAAVSGLISLIQGDDFSTPTVKAKPVLGGSCGCPIHQRDSENFLYNQSLTRRIEKTETSMIVSMQMSATFSHITDIDEGMDALAQYTKLLAPENDFYLCLYPDWDVLPEGFSVLEDDTPSPQQDSVLLKLAIKKGCRFPECSFSKAYLLPEYLLPSSMAAYLVMPLFFGGRSFGYVVLVYEEQPIVPHFRMLQWLTDISQLLQNIYQAKKEQILALHLAKIYSHDTRTELLNYDGFRKGASKLLQEAAPRSCFGLLHFDIESLSSINRSFGWEEGDFALRMTAQAIQSCAGPKDVCARLSGDDFYVLLRRDTEKQIKEFSSHVLKYLDNYNRLHARPYILTLRCSMSCKSLTPPAPELTLYDFLTETS